MRVRNFLLIAATALATLVPSLIADDACPVTIPLVPRFIPPIPYPANPANGAFWFGTDDLWVELPAEGVWRGLPRGENGGYSNKLFLWQQGYDWRKEPQPDIIVVLRNLQAADAPLAVSRGGTNVASRPPRMLTGISFPTAGCWEVTAHHDGHLLTFVLSIEPSSRSTAPLE